MILGVPKKDLGILQMMISNRVMDLGYILPFLEHWVEKDSLGLCHFMSLHKPQYFSLNIQKHH